MTTADVDARPLAAFVTRRMGSAGEVMVLVAAIALIALAAQVSIPLPFTPVPITGQTFAVVLVGASLGLVRGTIATASYIILPQFGLPFYAGGGQGWEVVSGPTGGYIVAFPIAAAVGGPSV